MHNQDDILVALKLIRSRNLSYAKRNKLLEHFEPLSSLNEADSLSLSQFGLSKTESNTIKNPDMSLIERDMNWLDRAGHHLISLNDPEYPALLKEIHDPPHFLFINGQIETLKLIQVAIVGSRRPSAYGKHIAHKFAMELAELGVVVTSGLALGVDGQAHRSVVELGRKTVAVFGNGIDNTYPVSHKNLAKKIAETGAIVSEYPTGIAPLPFNFPKRNRIISGLSVGVIVIEAAQRSGSLITARLAMEQNRDVFAVPGSIMNPLAEGCHKLIKEGAKLVESVDDLLLEISSIGSYVTNNQEKNKEIRVKCPQNPAGHQKLLELMGYEPCHPDQLIEKSDLTAEEVCSILLDLEVSGSVKPDLCGNFVRVDN